MRCLLGLLLVSSVSSQDQETTPAAPSAQEPIAAPTPTNHPIVSCAKTEILYEIEAEADFSFPLKNMNTILRVMNATDPTLSRFESEDVFPFFEQEVRESDRYRYKKCLPKADCFLAQLDVWDQDLSDLVTFKQDGIRIESKSTFPRWNSTRTYVELGNCLPTCEVSGKDHMILSSN
jgi:hypothetical protein